MVEQRQGPPVAMAPIPGTIDFNGTARFSNRDQGETDSDVVMGSRRGVTRIPLRPMDRSLQKNRGEPWACRIGVIWSRALPQSVRY